MNIQPIVEGHGEVKAFPVLLRRLCNEAQAFEIDVNAPIRRKRSELVKEDRAAQGGPVGNHATGMRMRRRTF